MSGLGIKVMSASQNELVSIYLPLCVSLSGKDYRQLLIIDLISLRYRPIQMFYFFLCEFWTDCLSRNCPFNLGYIICGHRVIHSIIYYLLDVHRDLSWCPFLFLKLVICVPPFHSFYKFNVLTVPCGLQDLSSLTRDWTWNHVSEKYWIVTTGLPGNSPLL